MESEDLANEIMDKYLTEFEIFGVRTAFNKKRFDSAKKCALICIGKMIEQNGELYLNGIDEAYYRQKNGFLFEVKELISER